ncbi:MAG: hypothetical protein OSJ59_03865 [Lachnospiraceae bacterium]|nr:hypothetical protein [Lachnospiraceae bacterium]
MQNAIIVQDKDNHHIVIIPDIIFSNKQNINWGDVENYLKQYIDIIVEITESKDIVYIGKNFPNEFSSSKYTRILKGARAKAKANAVQGIREMLEIAANKTYCQNHKTKHNSDAQNGWYYYITRFALPIYENKIKTNQYNIYTGRLVINHTSTGKMYLYDLVDIKKEASNPFKPTM